MALVALFCAWAAVRWVWTPHRCNAEITRLARGTDAAEQEPDPYAKVVMVRENLAALLPLRESCRDSVRVYALVGQNQWLLGRTEEALASYREALKVDHRPELYLAIGDALIALGRFDEAVQSYTTAVRFRPAAIDAIQSGEAAQQVRRNLAR